MPRIRTLKPEHRQHRKVGALADRQYRLWVGMICEADDEGRLVADAEQLRALLWAFHPEVTTADVDSALDHLVSIRLVGVYWHGRTRYAFFPDWKLHQRINRPQPSKLPSPKAKRTRSVTVNAHGTLSEPAPTGVHGSEGIGRDQGRDRKGREGSGEGNPNGSHDPPSTHGDGQPSAAMRRFLKPSTIADVLAAGGLPARPPAEDVPPYTARP